VCLAGRFDCDGNRVNGCESTGNLYYQDADGDGYGNNGVTTRACTQPAGWVTNNSDCNDGNASIRPGATETCNSIDDNCNGVVDDRPIANDCPLRATDISTLVNGVGGQSTVSGNNIGATTDQSACTSSSYDVFYRFTLSERRMVYFDTFGSGFDTVVSILNSGYGQITCTDDSCGSRQTQVMAVLDPGTYYVRVAGWSSNSGSFVLNVQRLPASSAIYNFNAGYTTYSGNTSTATDQAGPGLCYPYGGSDHMYYWMACPSQAAGTVDATTCSRASWDTLLRYIDGRSGSSNCIDDSCGLQSTLSLTSSGGAGIRAMYVDGYSSYSFGSYSVYAGRP
jgi:hypothetical protein